MLSNPIMKIKKNLKSNQLPFYNRFVNKYLKPESFTRVIQYALTDFIEIIKTYLKLGKIYF